MEYPEVTTATQFCRVVENVLGWAPQHDPGAEAWKVYAREAGKVNRKIATNRKLYTWRNLLVAVEYLRRRHETPVSPAAVLWSVERALKEAGPRVVERAVSDVEPLIADAMRHEMGERGDGWDTWVSRFTRAVGEEARRAAYEAWREAGRG